MRCTIDSTPFCRAPQVMVGALLKLGRMGEAKELTDEVSLLSPSRTFAHLCSHSLTFAHLFLPSLTFSHILSPSLTVSHLHSPSPVAVRALFGRRQVREAQFKLLGDAHPDSCVSRPLQSPGLEPLLMDGQPPKRSDRGDSAVM